MDFTTVVGVAVGFAIILWSISLDGVLGNFYDFASVVIVVGGTIAAVVACYPMSKLKSVPKHFKILIKGNRYNPMEYINSLEEMAQIARKNGLLALEEKANETEDPFLKQSVMLIVDATNPNKVREILTNDLDYLSERHEEAVGIYEKAAGLAPAFGMIGTLIGLINMLKNMGEMEAGGTAAISQGMSTALVTTFYGCMLSNLLFIPIAKKLKVRNDEEYLCKQIIIEGVLSIQSGENPNFLKEKLISFLAQGQRENMSRKDDAEGEPGEDTGKKKKKKKK